MMKSLSHQDYPYVRPDLLVRLWKYKNRSGVVYDKCHVAIFGIVHTLTQTKHGIISTISPMFPDGSFGVSRRDK